MLSRSSLSICWASQIIEPSTFVALLVVMAQRSFVNLVSIGSTYANDSPNRRLANQRNSVFDPDRIWCKAIEVKSRQIEEFEPMNHVECHRLVWLWNMRYEDREDLYLRKKIVLDFTVAASGVRTCFKKKSTLLDDKDKFCTPKKLSNIRVFLTVGPLLPSQWCFLIWISPIRQPG